MISAEKPTEKLPSHVRSKKRMISHLERECSFYYTARTLDVFNCNITSMVTHTTIFCYDVLFVTLLMSVFYVLKI